MGQYIETLNIKTYTDDKVNVLFKYVVMCSLSGVA